MSLDIIGRLLNPGPMVDKSIPSVQEAAIRPDKLADKAKAMAGVGLQVDAVEAALWEENKTLKERPGTREYIRQIAERACGTQPGPIRFMPVVVVNNRQLPDVTREALAALDVSNSPPRIFMRAGALVRTQEDEKHRPVIRLLDLDGLAGEMARAAQFISRNEHSDSNARPPAAVVRDLATLPALPFPPLIGIIEAPTIRPDGSLITAAGYDAATRLYYDPATGLQVPTIPKAPTPEQVHTAVETLYDVIADFPFADSASLAHTYAMILTPLLRPFIRGACPLTIVDKPQAGTGATLLTEVAAVIATGRPSSLMVAPSDDDAWRKGITSLLMDGASFICVDNLEGRLWAPSLAAVITAQSWRDRILGRNETVVLDARAVWVATGNNIQLGGDLPRRAVWIRMDAGTSRPWQRNGFRHARLLDYVAEHRGELIAAALTLARGWIEADCPGVAEDCVSLGSFEGWRETIGGILRFAGVPAFLGNLESMYENADGDGPMWAAFFEAWYSLFAKEAKTLREVVFSLTEENPGEKVRALLDALPYYVGTPRDKGFTRSLGNSLTKVRNVHWQGGWVLRKAGTQQRAVKWVVEKENEKLIHFDAFGQAVKSESSVSSESILLGGTFHENEKAGGGEKDSRNTPDSLSGFGTEDIDF